MRTDLSTILAGGSREVKADGLQRVGSVTKTDGTDGSVFVKIGADVESSDLFDSDYLFVEVDGGIVPMRIEDVTRRGVRSSTIRLANICSVDAAIALVGSFVCARLADDEDNGDDLGTLNGYAVSDVKYGRLGTVDSIDDSVAVNPLFVIIRDDGSELLVPAAEAFVVSVDDDNRQLLLSLPEGLIDIDAVEEV